MTSIKRKKLIQGIHHLQQNKNITQQYQVQSTFKRIFKCFIQVWKFQQFRKLYPQIDIKEIVIDFQKHIELPEQVMGKKSSQIVISNSRKYCLKMITQEDLIKFQQIFDQYNNFKEKMELENGIGSSYLVDIYQVFLVHSNDGSHSFTQNYILMQNIRVDYDKTICVFDIKGHCDGRGIDPNDFIDFKYGKDQNFIISKELSLFQNNLSNQVKQMFLKGISEHLDFLNKMNIIDYSLLLVFYQDLLLDDNDKQQTETNVGGQMISKSKQLKKTKYPNCHGIHVTKNIYLKWSLIDYFQIYNKKKQMENKFKSVFRKNISSVQPQVYSNRMIQFLKQHLFKKSQNNNMINQTNKYE